MPPARKLASGLLLFTGVAHVLYALVAGEAGGGAGTAIAGGIYFAIGFALRTAARWPVWLGAILPALGGLGGVQVLLASFDPVMLLFVLIDAVVVACCVSLLVKGASA